MDSCHDEENKIVYLNSNIFYKMLKVLIFSHQGMLGKAPEGFRMGESQQAELVLLLKRGFLRLNTRFRSGTSIAGKMASRSGGW